MPEGRAPPAGGRKALAAWLLYDFANTSFTVMIVTFVYGVYFKTVVCAEHPRWGDALWGGALAASMLATAALTPVLGAAADLGGWKRRYLTGLTLLAVAASGGLWFAERGDIALGAAIFILGNIGYQGAFTFYNAFLPEVAEPARQGRVGGWGWACGYAGAIAIIVLCRPLLTGGFSEENLPNLRATFPITGAFFLVFSLPAFLWLRDRGGAAGVAPPGPAELWRIGAGRLLETWRSLGRYKEIGKFLLAYFAYIEGVNTVITFSTIYAKDTLGFSMAELVTLYLAVQTAGIVGALAVGPAADRFGARRAIFATLGLWTLVVLGAMLTDSKAAFWALGMGAGLGMGSCQSASRTLMSLMTPPGRAAEFFSFYGVFGKVSAALGPLLFGVVSGVFQTQRAGLGVVLAFLLVGSILLARVDEEAARALPKGA